MLLRHSRLVTVASALLLAFASNASATVLWDQSNWNTNGEGSVNLSSTACSQLNGNTKVHTASDVHFPGPVNISTVRIYETDGNAFSATQAYLWIAPKTGPVPTESSTLVNNAANLVPITTSVEFNGPEVAIVVSATGLNITLPAGDYWVSLTPRHSLGFFPYSVHRVTTGPIVGSPTHAIQACTTNSNWLETLAPAHWDYAIKIEGNLPVPTAKSTWSRVKSIYR